MLSCGRGVSSPTVNGIIEFLMRIDSKLDEVLFELRDEDDGEAEP